MAAQGKNYGERDDECLDDKQEALERDGGILGNPTGYRFATGERNVDVREAGEEMLRGRHAKKSFVE